MATGSSGKLLGGVVAAVVVVGILIGVRSLTTGDETRVETDRPRATEKSETEGARDSQSGSSRAPRVGTIDEGSKDEPRRTTTASRPGPRPSANSPREITTDPSDIATTEAPAIADATTSPAEEVVVSEEQMDDKRRIADLVALFKSQTDPSERIDTADELGMIDDPEAIRKLLELMQAETDPEVKEALVNALTGLESLEQLAPEAIPILENIARTATETELRIAAMDALGDLAKPESVTVLNSIYRDTNADPSERLSAAENLMRLRSSEPNLISEEQVREINEQLKLDFQAGMEAAYRSQAAMALALYGRENLPFFQEQIQREQDPNVKNLLEKLIRMQTANQQLQPQGTPEPR